MMTMIVMMRLVESSSKAFIINLERSLNRNPNSLDYFNVTLLYLGKSFKILKVYELKGSRYLLLVSRFTASLVKCVPWDPVLSLYIIREINNR